MDFYLTEMSSLQPQSNSRRSISSLMFLRGDGGIGRLFQWSNPFRTLNYHGRRQPALLVLWTLLFIGYLPTAMQTEQRPQPGADCASCGRDKYLAVLKEEEVRQLRIESTKQQILDRLEMEDRPPRVKTKDISQMLLPSLTSSESTESISSPLAHQIILFPVKIFRERNTNNSSNQHRSERLKFHITEEMYEAVLKSAVLWTAKLNQTSSEAIWESTEVTESVDKQIDPDHRHRYVSLPVSTPRPSVIEGQQTFKPYLIVQLDPSTRRTDGVRRRKRSAASPVTPMCGPNVTQCCRESLYVSFRDVGWDDWILAPLGFHAFYCRGSCRTSTAPASSANTHTSVLQKLLARDRVPTEARPHLAPCCAPTRLSPLTIFYTDESDVIRQRSLPNMIVESCGCAL